MLLVDSDHLLDARCRRVNHVIRQQHGKRFVAHKLLGAEHRVAQAPEVLFART